MGLHICVAAQFDEEVPTASWRHDEGATSCRDEAWMEMSFTLHELISGMV